MFLWGGVGSAKARLIPNVLSVISLTVSLIFLHSRAFSGETTLPEPEVSSTPIDTKLLDVKSLEEKPVDVKTVETKPQEYKMIEADGVRAVVDGNSQKKLPYNPKSVAMSDYEPYLATLNLGSISIAESFVMYGAVHQNMKYYIPLASLLGAMHVQIEQKDDKLVGWFLKEQNVIDVDLKTGTAKIGNETYQFTANDAVMLYTDILVSMEMLEKMFPLTQVFDLAQQILTITTTTPFPIEQEISRAKMLGSLGKGQRSEEEELKNARLEAQDYQMFSIPSVDASYTALLNTETFKPQQVLSFTTTGHLLKSSMNTTGSATADGITNMRVSLQKSDTVAHPFEHYLRPKQYWIGDISTPATNLITTSNAGIGASISNIPPGWKIDFNNLQITGYAIPNWSVEIHLNNNLLNFASVDATGLYAFQDIPLNVGVNTVKLIFYGPFGQTREAVQTVNLSSSLLQKGKFVYDFAVLKEKLSLIQTPASKNQAIGATVGGERYFGSVRYGLTGSTSISLAMTSYMKKWRSVFGSVPERQNYLSTSFMTDIMGVIVNTDLAYHANTNSAAIKLSTNATVFKESNLMVTSQFFTKSFISEVHTQSGQSAVQSSSEIRLKNNIKMFGKFIASTYSTTVGTTNSGAYSSDWNMQHSFTPIKPLAIVNTVTAMYATGGMKTTSGNASATVKIGRSGNVRVALNYVPLFGSHIFTTSSLMGNYNWKIFGISTAYNFNIAKQTGTYVVGLNVNSKYLTTSLQLGAQASASMNLNWNFNRSVVFNEMRPSIMPSGAANAGMIELNAFYDTNNNGEWDFDELPAQNIAAKISGKNSKELTGENGKVLIGNLPIDVAILFDGDVTVVEDMGVKVSPNVKHKIMLKAGAIHRVLIPIVKTCDVEGTLSMQMGEEKIPISGAKIHMIDRKYNVIGSTTTSSDGYYIFNALPQGAYKVIADKAIVARYKNYLLTK